jgi:hypothetical protein
MAEMHKVRTGPTSYLNLNAEDYKAWKAAGNKEYQDGDDNRTDLATEQANQDAGATKAEAAPAENKARRGPAEKK